jgi:hypothetical protein
MPTFRRRGLRTLNATPAFGAQATVLGIDHAMIWLRVFPNSVVQDDAQQGAADKGARVSRRFCNEGLCDKCSVDDDLCLAKDVPQMILALETLGVDLVDGLGSGRARGKPPAFRDDLDPANRRVVPRCPVEYAPDGLTRQFLDRHLLRRKTCQLPLLLVGGRSLNAIGSGLSEVLGERAIDFGRILAGSRGDLRR